MAINGLLTKVIFDNNPTHEFFVEESFPAGLDVPHLTPFGVIMKINRQPLLEVTGRRGAAGPRVLEPIFRAAHRQLDHV